MLRVYQRIRSFIFAGLTLFLPVLAVLFCAYLAVGFVYWIADVLPAPLASRVWLGQQWVLLDLAGLFFAIGLLGALAESGLGKWLVAKLEIVVDYFPGVRTLYRGVKEGALLFFSSRRSFEKVVLLEYPRKGCWSIGFLTNQIVKKDTKNHRADWVTVFVPTTPNPTSGYVLMLPIDQVEFLEVSVEDALRFVISIGASGKKVLELVEERSSKNTEKGKK